MDSFKYIPVPNPNKLQWKNWKVKTPKDKENKGGDVWRWKVDRQPGTYLAEEESRKPAYQNGERVEGSQQDASIP